MPDFTFYTKPEYYAELIARLAEAKPGDRFMTANMVTWVWRPEVAALMTAMTEAAQRGVNVALITDAHNFLVNDDERMQPGPLLFHQHLPSHGMAERFQAQLNAFEGLKAAGGRYVIVNQPSHPLSLPVAGRCHIKFSVVNDSYFIGGCNMESYHYLDMMVSTQDSRVADWLAALGERLLATGSATAAIGASDITYEGAPGTTFYLDSGVRHRSVILSQALAFIDAAQEHVTITCKFFPGGITSRHLKAAHERGVKVRILYNRPAAWGNITSIGYMGAELLDRLHNPGEFFSRANQGAGFLHAKLIATEQGAMVGSHNFVQQGVALGTAEIAMLVRDPEFARRAVETVTKQLS